MRKHSNLQAVRRPRYGTPQPQRVRQVEGPFAWIDYRVLRNGDLAVLNDDELTLYLFLVLAAGRHGVASCCKQKICDLLGLNFGPFEAARDRSPA